MHDLAEAYRGWIDESVKKKVRHFLDGKRTESVAVGSRAFVAETKERLDVRDRGRKLVGTGECCELVSVHRWPFSAIPRLLRDRSASIGGIACAAYSSMPPRNAADFLELSKNCSFLDRKLINALHETADGHDLREPPPPYNEHFWT